MDKSKLLRLMIVIVALAVVFLTIKHKAFGQQRIIGQDVLALQSKSFNAASFITYSKSGSAFGTLDFTFGASVAPIYSALNSGKFSAYRVHLIDGTCIANGNCGDYSPFRKYTLKSFEAAVSKKDKAVLNFVRDRTSIYCSLQKSFPSVKIYISPVLEHKLGTKAFRILADTVLKTCPGIGLVNNSVTGDGEKYHGALLESHDGFSKPRSIVSFDGLDATDSDIGTWLTKTSGGKISFIWSRLYNCRLQNGWIDPRKRAACPRPRDFELLLHLSDDRGKPPTPTFKCSFSPLIPPRIWKPLAEDTGSKDKRANLPVAIVPGTGKTYAVVTYQGTSLGLLNYFGPFTEKGLNRYYSGTGTGLSGYQMEKKALELSGSSWVYLKQDNSCIGPFVPGIRGGKFR